MFVWLGLLFATAAPTQAGQYGTAEEAKAMLDRAVAAVKEDRAKALDMFNKGEGGFSDPLRHVREFLGRNRHRVYDQ